MTGPSTFTAVHPPAAPTRPSMATRIADYTVMTLAVVMGGGSIVLFAWADRPMLFPLDLSPAGALWWNAFLSCVFFAQHSIMVRRPVRAWLKTVIPARYDVAFYAICSGIVLALVVLLFQPKGRPLFVLHGAAAMLVNAAAIVAVAVFAWGIIALRTFDPFGLRPIREHLRGSADDVASEEPARAKPFVVNGPYRWVRHPLYSAVVVMLWADPAMSLGRLELALLWTAWIYVGAILEERDLVAELGDAYRRYCERVPMLVPWRWPRGA